MSYRICLLFLVVTDVSFVGCSNRPVGVEGPPPVKAVPSLPAGLDLDGFAKDGDPPQYPWGEVEAEYVMLDLCNDGLAEVFECWAEAEEGVVAGAFRVHDYDVETGDQVGYAMGAVICVTFEKDGRTARLGGYVEEGDWFGGDMAGTYAVWTVPDVDDDGVPDQTTDIRYSLPVGYAEYHCAVGFAPEAFQLEYQCGYDPETGLLQTQSGSEVIKVDYVAE